MGRPTRSKSVLADKTNVRRKSVEQTKKLCVYQLNKDSLSPEDDSDIYEFAFDSSKEPPLKAKKRRAKPQKPAVKRLKAPAKSGSKDKKSTKSKKPLVQPAKPLQAPPVRPQLISPVLSRYASASEAHIPAALRKGPTPVRIPFIISSPQHSSPSVAASPAHFNVTNEFVPMSPVAESRPESPPLDRLFDDDEDDEPLVVPKQGPTRFEFRELADARARVIRSSLTPRNAMPAPLRASTPEPAPSKMKQTSILNFVKSPEEDQGCSTPYRVSSPIHCSMLSPVKDPEEERLNRTDVDVEEQEMVSEDEDDDVPRGPMRLSMNTLKQVMEANKETLAKEQPPSPKKYFHKPARKSYEKRSRKKALDFFEMESDHESENDENREEEPEEEAAEPKQKKKVVRKKKEDLNAKAFEEWASKFNQELQDYEEFDLAVE